MSKLFSENINKNKVQKLLSSNKPLMLEVREECCDDSTLIDKIIEKIENEFDNNISIARIDYRTYRDLLPEINIKSLPIVLLIKDGNIFKVVNGTITRANLRELANLFIKNNKPD